MRSRLYVFTTHQPARSKLLQRAVGCVCVCACVCERERKEYLSLTISLTFPDKRRFYLYVFTTHRGLNIFLSSSEYTRIQPVLSLEAFLISRKVCVLVVCISFLYLALNTKPVITVSWCASVRGMPRDCIRRQPAKSWQRQMYSGKENLPRSPPNSTSLHCH